MKCRCQKHNARFRETEGRLDLTMSERDNGTLSGVMTVLSIRNLSLHFVASSRPSFMACRMTGFPATQDVFRMGDAFR